MGKDRLPEEGEGAEDISLAELENTLYFPPAVTVAMAVPSGDNNA